MLLFSMVAVIFSAGIAHATLSCSGCHGLPPLDAAYRNITTGGFQGNHRTHMVANAVQANCAKCHPGSDTFNSSHRNGLIKVSSHLNSSPVTTTYRGFTSAFSQTATPSLGVCANANCHFEAATPTWGSTQFAYTSPTVNDCNKCHGAAPSDGSHPAGSGSGKKHGDYYGTTTTSCVKCHSDHTAETNRFAHATSAGRRGLMLSFAAAPNNGFGRYTGNVNYPNYLPSQLPPRNGTCKSTYCHSNGTSTTPSSAPPNITPAWGSTLNTTCSGCHGNDNSAAFKMGTVGSAGHAKHVQAYAYGCVKCHAATVSDNRTIANYANHVTQQVNVAFNNSTTAVNGTYNGSVSPVTKLPGSATGACGNVYCHSLGNKYIPASRLPGAYGGSIYAAPNWNGVGTLACNSCHGRSTSNGMPDYTNGKMGSMSSNSHPKHVTSSAIGCVECHEKTTKNNTTIRSTLPSKHADGTTHDVYFNLSGSNKLGTYDNVKRQCSNTYCHGTGPSLAWGGSTSCISCHGASFTTMSSASKKGAHAQHIETDANIPTSYAGSGLGNLSTDPTKYQFGCASCHNPALAGHANAVSNSGGGAAEVYFGYSSAGRKGTYNPGTVQAGTDNGFKWTSGNNCTTTYCHSNGNGSNGNYFVNWTTHNGRLGCSGCHGGNAASGTVIATGKHRYHVDPSFNTSLGTGNGFGCVQCHAKTVSNDTTISNKTNHVNKFKDYSGAMAYGPSHYSTTTKQCTNIYCHSNGNPNALVFINMTGSKVWNGTATLGCNGCHGRSNPATGAPDYANGGVGTTTANNHAKHVAQLNITDTSGCAVCHKRTVDAATASKLRNYSTLHLNGVPNVAFNSAKTGASATWTSGTCTNVTCHSNGRGVYQSPQWGQTDNCGFCHPIASLGGAHAKHIDMTQTPVFYSFTANRSSGDDTTGKYNFGCSNCHPLANGNHTNGTIVIDFRPAVAGVSTLRSKNNAAINAFGSAGTVNGGTLAGSVSGSTVKCLNIYCHSNGYAAGMVYATTPDWYGGAFAGDRCANCHGNSPNSTIAGSPAHYNTNFIGTGTTSGHVVGIHYNDISNGATGEATAGTGTANSHGNSLYSSTMNCDTCHYATVTTSANDKNVLCTTCHNGTQATLRGNAAIANKSNHVSGSVNVAFNPIAFKSKAQVRQVSFSKYSGAFTRPAGYKAAGSYDQAKLVFNTATMWNSGSKTCSNISCHNGQTVVWTNTNGVTTCRSCHTSL